MSRAPRLQLALDFIDLDRAARLVDELAGLVDIVEVGTPLIICEGLGAVRRLKERAGATPVLADLKIADAGYGEARLAFAAGADLVTVLGLAGDATVSGAVQAAREAGGQIVADLLQVTNLTARGRALEQLGVDYLAVHTAADDHARGADPLDALHRLQGGISLPLFVAGGIGPDTIDPIAALRPDTVVVGGAITQSDDPLQVAGALRARLDMAQA